MHRMLPWLVLGLLLGTAGPLAAQPDLRAILDRAVQAHGGAERLSKLRALETRGRGLLHLGDLVPFTTESFIQMPDQMKTTLSMTLDGKAISSVQVLNRDRAWSRINGQTREFDDVPVNELREQLYADRIGTLVVLREPGFELVPLPEVPVRGRPADGIRVRSRGHRDVDLFFDRETGLLIRTQTRAIDLSTGKEMTREKLVLEFREANGLKTPRRIAILRDGKPFLEMDVLDVRVVERLDDRIFAQP